MAQEDFFTVNIGKCLNNKIEGLGESDLRRAISTFSSIDPHVEAFLKDSAEDFSRQHKSVTHLAFSSDMTELLGYFALSMKPITVRAEMMSKTMERAFKKMGKFDEIMNTYTVSAYLIAQLGKNFAPSLKNSISGAQLLEVALYRLKVIQEDIGGTIVFLEAQNNEKVLSFYQGNGFRELGRRMASYKDGAPYELIRMVKVL